MKFVIRLFEFFRDSGIQLAIFLFCIAILAGMDYALIGDPFRVGKIRYLLLAYALCQTLSMWKIHPAWSLFAGWSLARWVLADFPEHGVIDVLLIPAALLVGAYWVRSTANSKVVPKIITAIALLQCVYGFMQFFGFDPFLSVEPSFRGVPIGTLGHQTMLGPLLALGALFFLQRWKNWKFLAIAAFMTLGVLSTGSTMSILALCAGAFYTLWRRRPAEAYGAGVFLTVSLGIGYLLQSERSQFFSFSGRLLAWPYGLEAWLQAPFFGHGPGSWLGYLNGPANQAAGMRWDQLHNEFLQVLVEQGLVGFGILAVGLVLFFRKAQHLCPLYGSWAVVLCVNAMGNFPMHLACFGLIAGWLAAYVHHAEEPSR